MPETVFTAVKPVEPPAFCSNPDGSVVILIDRPDFIGTEAVRIPPYSLFVCEPLISWINTIDSIFGRKPHGTGAVFIYMINRIVT